MITEAESGLSHTQYMALKSLKENQSFKVVASRYNLDFGASAFYTSPNTVDNDSTDWDACVVDNYLFRVIGSGTMERLALDAGTWSTQAAFVAPSGLNPTCPYTMVGNAGVLHVFASTATGIQENTTSDYGITYSGWNLIYSFATSTAFYTPNRCVGGAALASSTDVSFGATAHQASNAFDEAMGTAWAAVGGVVAATLRYDFNATTTPTPIITHYALNFCNFKTWTFQGSPDGSAWTTIQTVTNDTGTQIGWREYTVTNTTAYRYYRFNVTACNAATAAVSVVIMQESTAEQSIMWVSAPSYDRIHFLFGDPANRLYNLRVLSYSGSWAMAASDIWLTKKPNTMDAETNGTSDWIVMDTEVPGRVLEIADKTTGTKKKLYSMGGLISFEYKNADWADHVEVDVVDTLSAFKYRKNVKCSAINGKMYLTCYSSSGTEAYPFTSDRIYTTKDGRNYSNGNLFAPDVLTGISGCILLAYGDYVYAVERQKVWQSYSTLYTGTVAADIQVDITDYIDSYSTVRDPMFQFNMRLHNATGWLDNHSFIKGTNVLVFQHYVGGVLSGVEYTYLDAISRIDEFKKDERPGEYMVSVSGRDFLSFMSDYVTSEGSVIKESTLYGLDTFADKTGTQYGGLSHLATIDGEINTSSTLNAIVMNSTDNLDRAATGFSTFSDDMWNGSIDTSFTFSGYTAPFVAAAGLAFKSKDKTILCSMVYRRQADSLVMTLGPSQEVVTATSIGWQSRCLTDYCFIRLWMHYGKLRGYVSNDGITWTLKLTVYFDMRYAQVVGAPYIRDINDFSVIERGFVGVIATIPHTGA